MGLSNRQDIMDQCKADDHNSRDLPGAPLLYRRLSKREESEMMILFGEE